MPEQTEIPLLLELIFPDLAAQVLSVASPRLLAWCQAFDDWQAERRLGCKPATIQRDVAAWRLLLRWSGRMPWELSPADIQAHADRMQAEDYEPSTVLTYMRIFSNFYRWCAGREIDPHCPAGFDPAAAVAWPHVRHYERAQAFSREQVQALLGYMSRDASPIGLRDYAFFQARLRLGVPLDQLRRLQWGQIERDGPRAWVRWRPPAEPYPLPQEVWDAVQAYLAASGRLPGMQADSYTFALLVHNLRRGDRPQDWIERRCLSRKQVRKSLKLYGRLAGLPEEKLELPALRHTAIRLRLDEGASLEEMRVFLDFLGGAADLRQRLRVVPQLPPDDGLLGRQAAEEPPLPSRIAGTLHPASGLPHGFFTPDLPEEQLQVLLDQDISGLNWEIGSFRTLARGLLARQGRARSGLVAARLGDAYTVAASRLSRMIAAEKELVKRTQQDHQASAVLEMLNSLSLESGGPPVTRESFLAQIDGGSEQDSDPHRSRQEVIAGTRCVLRSVFALATTAQDAGELDANKLDANKLDANEYIHLVDIYGRSCVRLVQLLKGGSSEDDRVLEGFHQVVDQAISDLTEEWGLAEHS